MGHNKCLNRETLLEDDVSRIKILTAAINSKMAGLSMIIK